MKKLLLLFIAFWICSFTQAQTIAEIQGTGDDSPFSGMEVSTTGIVTATHGSGYFIQDGTAVRSGVYVFDQTNTPQVGDEISLTGIVDEYYGLTELKDISALTVSSSNNTLPDPLLLNTADVPNEDYEGMLVTVEGATCTNPDLGFGEWELNDGSGACRVDDLLFYLPLPSISNIKSPNRCIILLAIIKFYLEQRMMW